MKKKIIIVLSAVVLLIVSAAFIQSCTNDLYENDDKLIEVTNADLLIASPQFQAYEKSLRSHTKKIATALNKLTPEQRIEVNKLLELSIENPGLNNFDRVSEILGYDLATGFGKVRAKFEEIEFPVSITQEEYIKALYRKDKLPKIQKVKSSSEQGDDSPNPELAACVQGCNNSYSFSMEICKDITNPDSYIACCYIADNILTKCINECGDQYP